jgi:hypothetical protein
VDKETSSNGGVGVVIQRVNVTFLAIATVVLIIMMFKSLFKEDDSYIKRLEEIQSYNEMKIGRVREDLYALEVKHERDVALLRQQMNEKNGVAVQVGNVNTNVK